jgi:pseudomonalisin/xanthomonalisin
MLAAHPTLGFAGPHLYSVSTASYHDITSGSNGGETATVGWDYASGFGSGIVSALNAGL